MPRFRLFRGGQAAFAAGLCLGLAGGVRADFEGALRKFLARDVQVIAVTDVTDAGKNYQPATPAKPVRYKLIYLGQVTFGRSWAGEILPGKQNALKWIQDALAGQGYLLADELHPPEQLLVYGWGMISGGEGHAALRFLGGDKLDLMWEQEPHGGLVDARVLLRGLQHSGIGGKVWEFSGDNLFLGVVRSFTLDSMDAPQVTQLWETRFGCPANGLVFTEAMPLLVKGAAASFGRETLKPVSVNATDVFGGDVTLRELEILGEAIPTAEPKPAPEAAKRDRP